MSHYESILYSEDQNVATIVLNRPQQRNALTPAMLTELHDAVQRAGEAATVRAVVLAGEGKGFCAGQDLSAFSGVPSGDEVRTILLDHYRPLVLSMVALGKPIVGAINGVAAGAGMSLALACDLRVMATDASLMLAFSNIGLVPDAGATWFLVRQVGYSRALEMAASARRVSAAECLKLGLTNEVVEPDALREVSAQMARALASRPTLALGWTKELLTLAATETLAGVIEHEADRQARAVETGDHVEGIAAFLERRAPSFSGS